MWAGCSLTVWPLEVLRTPRLLVLSRDEKNPCNKIYSSITADIKNENNFKRVFFQYCVQCTTRSHAERSFAKDVNH